MTTMQNAPLLDHYAARLFIFSHQGLLGSATFEDPSVFVDDTAMQKFLC